MIDAEDVVEAVAHSGRNAAQTRAVAVSLAFSEGYTPENDAKDDVQRHTRKRRHIERESRRPAMKSFLATSRRFIFPTGRLGHSAEQKVAAALRVLVFAEAHDQPDHFLRMSEESIRHSFLRPTQHITEIYATTLKLPTNEEGKVISQRFA
jgi:hypothetical protein